MSSDRDRQEQPPEDQGDEADGAGEESRREFMKKLPYVAPVIQSFVLADTVYAASDKDKKGRGRGRVSAPGQNDPPSCRDAIDTHGFEKFDGRSASSFHQRIVSIDVAVGFGHLDVVFFNQPADGLEKFHVPFFFLDFFTGLGSFGNLE